MTGSTDKVVVKLEGEINFTRVVAIRKMGEAQLSQNACVQFDFSHVSHCDSSALVLLMAWKRFATRLGIVIEFLHLPPSLVSLAMMCNVKSLIES